MLRPTPFPQHHAQLSHEAFANGWAHLHHAQRHAEVEANDIALVRVAIANAIVHHDELGRLLTHEWRHAATLVTLTTQLAARQVARAEPGRIERLPVVLDTIGAVGISLTATAAALELTSRRDTPRDDAVAPPRVPASDMP